MPSPADPHDTVFQAALNKVIRKGIASPVEMAQHCDRSPSHIRAVARGDRHLSGEAKEELSSWLCDARGCTLQVDGMLGLTYDTHKRPTDHEPDDCLLEDMAEVSKAMSRADDALKEGRVEEARQHMERAFEELKGAKEDARRLHDS